MNQWQQAQWYSCHFGQIPIILVSRPQLNTIEKFSMWTFFWCYTRDSILYTKYEFHFFYRLNVDQIESAEEKSIKSILNVDAYSMEERKYWEHNLLFRNDNRGKFYSILLRFISSLYRKSFLRTQNESTIKCFGIHFSAHWKSYSWKFFQKKLCVFHLLRPLTLFFVLRSIIILNIC